MLIEIIVKQHDELRELFACHQEALLQGEFKEASIWLAHFVTCQRAHIEIEEKYLLPEFEKIERTSRWEGSLYEKEHDKIKHLHKNIIKDLDWLSEQSLNESDKRRNIIALLDKEKTLKGLIEHHEEREEKGLLKDLDAYMDVGGRAESGTEAERAKKYKQLQLDINLTWAEVIASIRETTA